MATSPLVKEMDYISINILVNGKAMNDSYSLFSVEVEAAINAVPRATFTILLPWGESENKGFAISEGTEFVPGTEVEIKVGYESTADTIFKGIIIRHGLKAKGGERPQLVLHCQDKAVKLTVGNKIKPFAEQTDSAIIGSIIDEHGLSKDVDSTPYTYPQLIQSGTTDWDFIVSRAEANGLLVYAEDGKVLVKKPLASGSPDLELSYDRDVFDFVAELDAGYQLPSVTASGWDSAKGDFVEAKAKEPASNQQGNLTGKQMAKVLDVKNPTAAFTTPLAKEELQGIADGTLLRSRLAALRGSVTFFGNAKPKLNTLIELKGFGKRFNGEALITSVRHTVRDGTWRTETSFGLSPDWHHEKHGLGAALGGLLPSVNGLQNGVVKQLLEDQDGQYRILVTIPVLGAKTDVWSRLSTGYAGKGHGIFLLPEVGDEVVVGFLNDDPRYAIILGSVYSSKNAPLYTADEQHTIMALVSKNQLKIELDDGKKIMTIATPGGNSVMLSDEDKSITITDQNKNVVTMASDGITLKSPKDITLDAGGKITLKAKQNIEATSAGGDVALQGNNVNGAGKIGVKLKGGASAELSAGGQTTVKGAMVMIN